MLEAFVQGFLSIFEWPAFGFMLLGVAIGFAVGVLPGPGGAVTLAPMLPSTFFNIEPVPAFAFLLAMLAATGTTGDIASVLFAIPEVLELAAKGTSIADRRIDKLGGVWQGVKDTFAYWAIVVRCSMIGTFIGFIPGIGASVSQWLAYAHAVQSSKDHSGFGKGHVREVLGPGAANNSSMGGGLIPTVTFGVPGNVAMAILLGAFLVQGLTRERTC